MKNIFQKSALALTIATLSVGAFAADIKFTTAVTDHEIVLANEVFGSGSQATLIATPDVTFEVTAAAITTAETATVKFTLNKDAVFGEDLSDITKWAAANLDLNFTFTTGTIPVGQVGAAAFATANTTANNGVVITVDQGGAIGDNTVTFKITGLAANDVLEDVQMAQVRVKGLTSALARGVANPTVSLGAEYRNVTSNTTQTDTALVIFKSQNGVELTSTEITDYTDAPAGVGLRARIDVADVEESFTGDQPANTGTGAAQDFDEDDNVAYVDLGNLFVNRTETNSAWSDDLVKKENGNDFDFNGSDDIAITITSTQVLDAYSKIYLRSLPGACDDTVVVADFDVTPTAGSMSATISLSGETTVDLEDGYRVCAIASGTKAIPESSFSAALAVDYFNPRYTNSEDTLGYGPVLRNGCQITLFNLPNVSASDDAFIRLTNVSEKPGAVRAFVWAEDGSKLDVGSQLVTTLAAHATTVLHTAADQATGTFLGTKMPVYGALTTGRHRLVIQGAFPACEGMGLVRTPAGVLTNMTSTTYSGDESRLGAQNNGTSNTTN